ncbi:MAG TPA: sigma-70 family RNA polymerase sigma factor [Flavobacteriales bacterium]|jgi:RNA polymerase sigma factor (sigma-70 family)|nr:sigma-70 family RNA polymerase sigma factor [Flavobacteriales bacterium]
MFLRRKAIATHTDEELVRLLREGHRSALADLWDRYAELLYGVGMKYLRDTERSKDEVVELFAGLKDLIIKHDIERFRPWVHTVMRNRCLQVLRKERPDHELPENLGATSDTEDDAVLREASLQELENAMTGLNAEQRQCIRLFHLEERSYAQVATSTGFTVEQVRSHLQNGRRNLRILIQRQRA